MKLSKNSFVSSYYKLRGESNRNSFYKKDQMNSYNKLYTNSIMNELIFAETRLDRIRSLKGLMMHNL